MNLLKTKMTKLEKILKQTGKLILIGIGIYLTYKTIKDYRLKEERKQVYQDNVPLFI